MSQPESTRSWHSTNKQPPAAELEAVALKAFFNITKAWGLTDADCIVLLGEPARSTFYNWKSHSKNGGGKSRLGKDVLERISYIMGIYKNLRILFTDENQSNGWVKRDNSAPPFAGASALAHMKKGRVVDLADVRRYLDAQRAW